MDYNQYRGQYIMRRAWGGGLTIYIAEYVTHDGEVRYLAHSAVIDPIRKLIDTITGARK